MHDFAYFCYYFFCAADTLQTHAIFLRQYYKQICNCFEGVWNMQGSSSVTGNNLCLRMSVTCMFYFDIILASFMVSYFPSFMDAV